MPRLDETLQRVVRAILRARGRIFALDDNQRLYSESRNENGPAWNTAENADCTRSTFASLGLEAGELSRIILCQVTRRFKAGHDRGVLIGLKSGFGYTRAPSKPKTLQLANFYFRFLQIPFLDLVMYV